MRDLRIKEVIKAIQLEDTFKQKLLAEYEGYDEGRKFAVTKVCWDAFSNLEDALRAYWREKIISEIASGTRRVSSEDIENELEKEVVKEIEDRITGQKEDKAKLEDIRAQLEKYIK